MRPNQYGTKSESVFRDIFYRSIYSDEIQRKRLQNSVKDSLDFVQRLTQTSILKVHKGCVNTVIWNKTGQTLLSGSDDLNFVLTNPFTGKVQLRYKSLHRANIFSAKFLPGNDRRIVSCSGDGIVAYTDLTYPPVSQDQINEANLNYFNCHSNSTTYEILTIPTESEIFLSCGEDTTIRLYDLRKESKCHKTKCKDNILISSPAAITTMDITPISMYYLAVGSSDGYVRIYDRRYLGLMGYSSDGESNFTVPIKAFSIPAVEKRGYRITSVGYSADEQELLASYSSEHLYLFDVTQDGISTKESLTEKNKRGAVKTGDSPPPVRRLRLRNDWSDTGPESRPSWEGQETSDPARPSTVMSRMTEVLSRMLSDTNRTNFQGNEIPNEHDLDIVNTLQNLTDASSETNRQPDEMENTNETAETDEKVEDIDMKEIPNYSHIKQKYTGHRNSRTMIKESSFYGNNYVMSGSDCGHIFVWNKHSGQLVNVLQGDKHVVNCIQPHPTLNLLATSGIDYDIKLWTPVSEESTFDETVASELMKRNDVMLKETRDTITVPASFMILLLSSLSRSRTVASATPRYQNLIQNLRQRNRDRRAAQENSNNNDEEMNEGGEASTEQESLDVSNDQEMSSDDEAAPREAEHHE
uniref:CSON004855 protein n=1 Tax=Culicoides sonorensis TaxID=179676 RepID=A0A336LFT1_CULSO